MRKISGRGRGGQFSLEGSETTLSSRGWDYVALAQSRSWHEMQASSAPCALMPRSSAIGDIEEETLAIFRKAVICSVGRGNWKGKGKAAEVRQLSSWKAAENTTTWERGSKTPFAVRTVVSQCQQERSELRDMLQGGSPFPCPLPPRFCTPLLEDTAVPACPPSSSSFGRRWLWSHQEERVACLGPWQWGT